MVSIWPSLEIGETFYCLPTRLITWTDMSIIDWPGAFSYKATMHSTTLDIEAAQLFSGPFFFL